MCIKKKQWYNKVLILNKKKKEKNCTVEVSENVLRLKV